MSRLTIQQAEAEARWRWGSLFVRGFAHYDASLKRPFQVGTICFGSVRIRGQGTSWEGAFSDAARQTNTEAVATSPPAQKSDPLAQKSDRASGPISNPGPAQIPTTRAPEARHRL
jgi:hypothetical protein